MELSIGLCRPIMHRKVMLLMYATTGVYGIPFVDGNSSRGRLMMSMESLQLRLQVDTELASARRFPEG